MRTPMNASGSLRNGKVTMNKDFYKEIGLGILQFVEIRVAQTTIEYFMFGNQPLALNGTPGRNAVSQLFNLYSFGSWTDAR